MANTETVEPKKKVTVYISIETAEVLRDYAYQKRVKISHATESALRGFLGLKNS